MLDLKKILVPTDFSSHSEKALRYGTELAGKFGSELHLMHVVEPLPIFFAEGAYVPPDSTAEMKSAAKKKLEEFDSVPQSRFQVVRSVVEGHPFVEIVKYAKEANIDLVIVGTHGRGAIAHMLLGSEAEKVVRKAPCPVLVVRDAEHDFVLP